MSINAFLLRECKPRKRVRARQTYAETFHCVSFVKQIGKLLSFVLFLYHHDAVLNETKRKNDVVVT
ncbi:hypothetical protein B9P84_11240 [Citrobacter braakii]|nr:hypothetical protein B9P84_11240 [Citrobacter braakii]POT29883.1 hypothetical protein C3423_21380 [Citrobacter braakii]POT34740.1 hypothetical protein C3431_21215 [Citrobacter braakii]POT39565.1 hypothetical protein C3425_21220 [Citrobacter braakii]POT63161.1 hypothetical protein C3428_13835 [Citrobacter braakii]